MFSKICIDTIYCKKLDCQLNHSRIYLGLCIRFLIMEEEWEQNGDDSFSNKRCDIKECKLQHLDESKFKVFSQFSINGIFPHNLCGIYDCPQHNLPYDEFQQNNCKLIHKPWAKNICLDNIINKCKKKNKGCVFNHQEWADVKEIGKEFSIIKFLSPEKLCDKQNCKCNEHYAFLTDQNICISFLKGICPNLKCQKNHVEWESITQKNIIENCIKPCTKIDQQQMTEKQFIQQQCEKAQFLKFKQTILQSNIIDVVFIMDLTGSMQPWKAQMENAIFEIIQQFSQTNKGYQIKFGFVGYRDECDMDDKITYINLTHQVDEFLKQIQKLKAIGGGDLAEDVVAGFEQALELNFSQHEESLLCTFLIADAPCHGRQYHDLTSDDKIDQIEQNYLEKVLKKYQKIKECNFLCCIKINESTNKMFQKMQDVFPLLTITSKMEPQDISDQVLFTLKQSLKESKLINEKISQKILIEADFQKYTINVLEQHNQSYNRSQNYWKNLWNDVDVYLRKGNTTLEIQQQINQSLQSDDQCCQTYIFKAFDIINNMFIVLKIPKFIIDLHNENKIDQKLIEKAEQLAETRFYSSFYACQMANCFNQRISKIQEIPPLFYVQPISYTLKTPLFGMTKIYGETFINVQHQFRKYTTNYHHSDPKYYYFSVFSHFSYIESGNTFVITDLQGCDNILSDPSIQTKKGEIPILDQDETNHNEKGIEIFLQTQHKECSQYCQQLQLQRFQTEIKQTQTIDFTKWQINHKEYLYGICDRCSQFTQYDLDAQKAQKGKGQIMICKICELESREKMSYQLKCKCCLENYQAFPNMQLRYQSEIGICQDCKQSCSKLNKTCCYCNRKCQKTLKQLTIANQILNICQNGVAYLKLIKCNKCQKSYQYDIILDKNDYDQGKYKCSTC